MQEIPIKHYQKILQELPQTAELLIVSKHRSHEEIMAYYQLGHRMFGENRAQELLKKIDLPKDIQWHFIGHLQRNKVKQILPYVSCIESLDSLSLAQEIEKQASLLNKRVDVYAEVHLALQDDKKQGLLEEEVFPFFDEVLSYPHLNLSGMMVMGPHTDQVAQIQEVFEKAHALFLQLQNRYGKEQIKTLSMGMSQDYLLALQCGSTHIRIGKYLFHDYKTEETV